VPLLEIVFDGVSDAADYQLDEILPEGRFERFQSDTVDVSLDDASESGIERLLVAGAALVEDRREALARIAATLVDPAIVARRVGPGPRPAPPPVAPGVSPPRVRLAPVATVAPSGRRGATPPGHPRGGR
jgi:hypothetical protein